MPIITTKRQATIFLGNEFISFKSQNKIVSRFYITPAPLSGIFATLRQSAGNPSLKKLYIPHCRRCQ
jgi:hypothetical protein